MRFTKICTVVGLGMLSQVGFASGGDFGGLTIMALESKQTGSFAEPVQQVIGHPYPVVALVALAAATFLARRILARKSKPRLASEV